nr:alpha/beta hydrolase [Aquibacillus saliphilus]
MDRLSCKEQKIDFHKPSELDADIRAYLNYYHIDLENIDFHFGKIEIDKNNISVQIFKPNKSKGTIFLLHGYLSHIGHLSRIIRFLNEQQYTVISYDLQGHGLSRGKTASVTHFSDYVITMEKLMNKATAEIPGPFYVIGHSTGAAITIDYLLRHKEHQIDKVILVAPLIRSNHWHLSRIGFSMAKLFPFVTDVKRNYRENTSEKSYLDFISNDPLQTDAIPLEWIGALIKWNEEIKSYKKTSTKTCIIQGNKDKTVDWKHNLVFTQEKFTNLEVVLIDNGKHELFNESKQIREIVFKKIHQFIET